MDTSSQQLEIVDLGQIDYQNAWDMQKVAVAKRLAGEQQDTLYLCEHNHVYTFGKSADRANLLINDTFLANINAQKFEIERGGDITYHGPGQLVGYPILQLHELKMGVKKYVDLLEQSLIDTLMDFGIETKRIEGLTGIWLTTGMPRKIAAIGIKVGRGVTMHGYALNVNTDLTYFNHIVPCGITDKAVTSMQKELGRIVEMDVVKAKYIANFKRLFYDENN